MYSLKITTPPAVEPVSIGDLLLHQRLPTTAENSLLELFISAARRLFEQLTGRLLITQHVRQYCPRFRSRLNLMTAPIQTIDSVHYYDGNDTLQTLTGYRSDAISTPANIYMPTSANWPVVSANVRPPVYVDFTAGYGDTPQAVPEDIRIGIMVQAAAYYERRCELQERRLDCLPTGFKYLVGLHSTGLVGPWECDDYSGLPPLVEYWGP